MNGPDHPRFRTVDADNNFMSQIAEATKRFIETSGNPPPIPWLIDEWVPEYETTLLAGPGSGGKSYIMLQLQASTALGIPWLGLAVPQCPSLGFYSEDRFKAIASRLDAIARYYRTTVAELFACGMRVLPKPSETALVSLDGGRRGSMTTTSEWTDLRRTLEVLKPKLLVLDNLADFLPLPAYDNSAIRQARHVALDPLCAEYETTIIGLQNVTLAGLRATDEAKDGSGGLAWRDAFRSRLSLRSEQPNDDDPDPGTGRVRTLARIKANNASDDLTGIKLRWRDGVFDVDLPASDTVTRLEQNANERWLMEAVIRVVQSGRGYSLSNNRSNYLPNLLVQEADRPKRFGAKSVKTTFQRLVCSDTIAIRDFYNPAKGRPSCRVVAVDGHNLQAE